MVPVTASAQGKGAKGPAAIFLTYAIKPEHRARAREALGLEPDEVAALFVGRLVYHAKAHPFAMYRGL